jgi:hypothetical protein
MCYDNCERDGREAYRTDRYGWETNERVRAGDYGYGDRCDRQFAEGYHEEKRAAERAEEQRAEEAAMERAAFERQQAAQKEEQYLMAQEREQYYRVYAEQMEREE